MPDQDVAEIAASLGALARKCLLGFSDDEARACEEIPFAPRLELFRAGLLIGANAQTGGGPQWGAKPSPLGLSVRAHLKGQSE